MTNYATTLFSIARDLSPNLAGGWATRNASPGSGPTRAYKFDDPPIPPYNAHLAHGGTIGDSLLRMFVQIAGPLGTPPTSLQLTLHSGYEYNGFDGSITQEYVLVSAHHVVPDLAAMSELASSTVNSDIDDAWLQLTNQPLELASDDTLMPGPFTTPWRPVLNAAGLASARQAVLDGKLLKFAVMARQDFAGTGPSVPVNVAEFLPSAQVELGFNCVNRIGPLPLEYRTAIGASCTRDSFDGTAILSLCQRDPNVSLDRCGALVNQNTRDYPDAQFTPRIGASSKTTRQLFRTGYGVRPAWDIEIRVATSRIGFLPQDAQRQPEINDGSLWHLMSIMGLEAADLDFEPGTPNPPYLWLTVNYQHYLEQWIPVEVDPDNSSIDPITINPETKTAERVMRVRLVARENYMRVLPAYFPSMTVKEIPGITVTSLAAHVAVPDGGFTAAATLSAALPADLGLQDGLLVNVGGGRYSWKLYTIAAMDAMRQNLTLLTATDLTGAYLIPPSIPAPFRSVQQADDRYLTTYVIRPFPGGQVAPARGPQMHLFPQTYLLGDPYQDLA